MQRWEYRVVSLRDGTYTATLNEYGLEGWELVSVTSHVPDVSPASEGGGIPMPRALGRLEDAAAKLNKFGTADSADAGGSTTSALLWVLRRPLSEDPRDDELEAGFES
jgi:hypothetical protein